MDQWIRRFRISKPVVGQSQVLIPGDPEREYHAARLASGIPLLPSVWEDLRTTGEKFNIKF